VGLLTAPGVVEDLAVQLTGIGRTRAPRWTAPLGGEPLDAVATRPTGSVVNPAVRR